MRYPEIKIFEPKTWELEVASFIHEQVQSVLHETGQCQIMLTGGMTARKVYSTWSQEFDISTLSPVKFYFGDERCVPVDSPESNYGMTMKTLFKNGIPHGCSVFSMEGDSDDRDAAANRYDAILPDAIDILLLSVGEDGHIASLFPNSKALHENKNRVVSIDSPKPPNRRLTITPLVISQARSIIVLATGASKAATLRDALLMPAKVDALPVRLTLRGTWLMDTNEKTPMENAARDQE